MAIKHIEVPAPITFIGMDGLPLKDEKGEPAIVTFKDFIYSFMNDTKWTRTLIDMRAGGSIMDAVKSSNGVVELAEEDWKKLNDVIETPASVMWKPIFMFQLLPFADAVNKAADKPKTMHLVQEGPPVA